MDALLQVLLAPENLFVNMACGLTAQCVYLALMTSILPPKSWRQFWMVEIVWQFMAQFLKPLYSVPVRTVVGFLGSMFIPLALLRGSVLHRVVVCSLCMFFQTFAELASGVVWVSLTGLGVMDNRLAYGHASCFLLAMLANLAVQVLVMGAFGKLYRRLFSASERDAHMASNDHADPSMRWVRRLALFPVIQVALVYAMVWVVFDVVRGEATYVATAFGLFALCVVADVLLLVQLGRSFRQRQAELEAALLEERVQSYLEELASMQNLLDDTARLRHDLRNHRAVVQALCDRGEYDEARRYLESLGGSLGGCEQ